MDCEDEDVTSGLVGEREGRRKRGGKEKGKKNDKMTREEQH